LRVRDIEAEVLYQALGIMFEIRGRADKRAEMVVAIASDKVASEKAVRGNASLACKARRAIILAIKSAAQDCTELSARRRG
jgi:hypothetical protein